MMLNTQQNVATPSIMVMKIVHQNIPVLRRWRANWPPPLRERKSEPSLRNWGDMFFCRKADPGGYPRSARKLTVFGFMKSDILANPRRDQERRGSKEGPPPQ